MTDQYFEDKEEERIVGEEEFINEPKTKEQILNMSPEQIIDAGIKWSENQFNRSEQSDRALEQLDRNINPNPLD